MNYEQQLEAMGFTQKHEEAQAKQRARNELNDLKAIHGYATQVDGEYHYDSACLQGIAFNMKNSEGVRLSALKELERRGVTLEETA